MTCCNSKYIWHIDDLIHRNSVIGLYLLRLADATAFLSLHTPWPTMRLDQIGMQHTLEASCGIQLVSSVNVRHLRVKIYC